MNDEIENLTIEDCYIPEDTKTYCHRGHDISEEKCVVCDLSFAENPDEEVGCVVKHRRIVDKRKAPDGHEYNGVSYKEIVTGHICMSCYDELPEGDEVE